MSLSILQNSSVSARSAKAARKESVHRFCVKVAATASFLFLVSLAIYGADYYVLPMDQRPYSSKYVILRPSGTVGLKLGMLGTLLFFIIFLYALRKVIPWLGRMGTARYWMDFHVVAGVTAPLVIAFHASFKFRGIAGVAFWIMVAVAMSGVVGRYLYAQIPRSLSAAELSLSELEGNERELAEALVGQSLYSASQLSRALRVPSREDIRRIGLPRAVCALIAMEIRIPFRVARLRRARSSVVVRLVSAGGLLSTGNKEIEHVVRLVRRKASLSKRIAFLDQTQRVFHLWHVIHRPFSYAFAVLALIHIGVVMGFGFARMGLR
jgi:hypothetical protein